MNTKPSLLSFKWTTSRGRDTYGYNICSLYVDGSKVSSCNGGGYDMQGTALAIYLVREYQDKLMAIKGRARKVCTQGTGMEWTHETNEDGLYGMTLLVPQKLRAHITIDGACGQSSVEKIAAEAGITLTSTQTGRNNYGYFLTA